MRDEANKSLAIKVWQVNFQYGTLITNNGANGASRNGVRRRVYVLLEPCLAFLKRRA